MSPVTKQQFEIERLLQQDSSSTAIDTCPSTADETSGSAMFLSVRDKVSMLEDQLLSAEEIIVHLKAEKLQLQRQLEKHQSSQQHSTEADEAQQGVSIVSQRPPSNGLNRVTVADDIALQIQHDQEGYNEKIAVIIEQEHELAVLKGELDRKDKTLGDFKRRNQQLLAEIERLEKLNQVLMIDEEEKRSSTINLVHPMPMATTTRASESASESAAAADDLGEWQLETMNYPTPSFDLDSPEVTYIIQQWSHNPRKQKYLRLWMQKIVSGQIQSLIQEFPSGLELPKLRPELRDGFLTLIIPILKRQIHATIQVHLRPHHDPQHHTDLRIRVAVRESPVSAHCES